MKNRKLILILAAMTMIAFVAVAMGSCKKEQESQSSDNGNVIQNASGAEAAIARITDFKKQVDLRKDHPDTKSTTTVSLGDAVADIVELFNAVYAQPENFYVRKVANRFSIGLPLTADGEVLMDDVVAAYEQTIMLARQAYLNDGIVTDKGYVGLILQLGDFTDDVAELLFTSISGQAGEPVSPNARSIDPFGEDDDWKYKAPLGKCDGTPGSGADEQIESMISSDCYDQGIDPLTGQRYYYYDYQNRFYCGCDHPDTIYYNPNINDKCIMHQQMNALYYSEKQYMKVYGPQATGLPLTGINRFHLWYFSIKGNDDEYNDNFLSHNITATYARRTLDWPIDVEPGDLTD